MGGSASQGKGSSRSTSQTGQFGVAPGQQAFGAAFPLLQEMFGQGLEGLRTGGIGAQAPLVQSSVSASRSATNQSLGNINETLSRSGLSGSPFGERTVAEAKSAGAKDIAGIPMQFVQQLLGIASPLAGQGQTSGLGALSNYGLSKSKGSQLSNSNSFSI